MKTKRNARGAFIRDDGTLVPCACPGDCGCRHWWRTNYCGCKQHEETR